MNVRDRTVSNYKLLFKKAEAIILSENGRFTITQVAERVGVTPKTIVRWEKAGKIRKPKRDWKGWRVYMNDDMEAIERLVNAVYEI